MTSITAKQYKALEKPAIRIAFTAMPPSANSMRQHFMQAGKVRSTKTKRYAAWKKTAAQEAQKQYTRPAVSQPYSLEIALQRNWRTKHARDVDNYIKPISDALVAGGVLADDYLCEEVKAYWCDHLEGVAAVATIEVVK